MGGVAGFSSSLIYGLKKLVALGDSDIEVTAGFFVVPELPPGHSYSSNSHARIIDATSRKKDRKIIKTSGPAL